MVVVAALYLWLPLHVPDLAIPSQRQQLLELPGLGGRCCGERDEAAWIHGSLRLRRGRVGAGGGGGGSAVPEVGCLLGHELELETQKVR